MADNHDKDIEDNENETFEDATANATESTSGIATPIATEHNEQRLPTATGNGAATPLQDVPLDTDTGERAVEHISTGNVGETAGIVNETERELIAPKLQIPENHPVLSPDKDNNTDTISSPPAKRKLFGWLTRTTSHNDKVAKGPSLPFRGIPVPNLTVTEDSKTLQTVEESPKSKRSSLQDRFKLARMREEAGIDVESAGLGADDFLGRSQSVDVTKEVERDAAAMRSQRANSVAGTGADRGQSPVKSKPENPEHVDWDLWQEVVYEGPTAVSRRSAKELNDAIAHGIPSAIRGVVWQVLADSKDENLEKAYRDLVHRQGGEEIPPTSKRYRPRIIPPQENHHDGSASRRSSTLSTTLEQPETIVSAASSVASPSSDGANHSASVTSPLTSVDDAESIKGLQSGSEGIEEAKTMDKLTVQKLERAIRRDMGTRTSYSKFLMSAGLQEGLFGICKAYALYDEDVGYAQGMNFIAMPLLFNMPEEEAFCLFVRLMNQYQLRNQFVRDMPGLHLHLYQFERLLEDLEPAVYCHLYRRGVSPQLYATQWFLTLFAYRFPLQLVLRIYDLILSEGLESAILKFGIVLMQKNAEQLLKMKDMVELTTFLKDRLFDVYIDTSPSATSVLESGFFGSASGGVDKEVYRADALVQDACAISVTPEMLSKYTKEWEEKVRDEKEKEAADEALKASNASLTLKVRVLEERAEKSDTEHVQTASELVRTKVINQQLSDENESLKLQVQQLKAIVDAQPGEVEGRLREEMDRIMQRNIEVQNENRALEEQTTEMEKDLVMAKMQYAEMNSELESMKKKWSSITALMASK